MKHPLVYIALLLLLVCVLAVIFRPRLIVETTFVRLPTRVEDVMLNGVTAEELRAYLLAQPVVPVVVRHDYPVNAAVGAGRSDLVAVLLDFGYSVEEPRPPGFPGMSPGRPIHSAILRDDPEMIEFLVSRGASLDQHSPAGRILESYARKYRKNRSLEAIRRLRSNPPTPTSEN